MSTEMEPWDRATAQREIAVFRAAGDLIGLSEEDLRERLGDPDEIMPGTSKESPSGQVLLQAEKDLRYFSLLLHTCVNISLLAGRVEHVGYWAKWKTCPPERRDSVGKQYAPV